MKIIMNNSAKAISGSRYYWIVLILICLILILVNVFIQHWKLELPITLDDDAYICFRYAENFVGGQGLVFNKGEKVEGYTDFLWIINLSGLISLSMNPLWASKILGICSLFGMLALVPGIYYFLNQTHNKIGLTFTLIFLSADPALSYWSTRGMETTFFSFLLMLSTYLFLRIFEESYFTFFSGISFSLCAMTRPEGILLFGLFFLFGLVLVFLKQHQTLFIVKFLIGFSILYLPYFLWRYNYYGHLLPNTFYMRQALTFEDSILKLTKGCEYLKTFWNMYVVALFCVVLLPIISTKTSRLIRILFFIIVIVVYSVYIVTAGGDYKYYYRFFIPILPFIYLLTSLSLGTLWDWLRKRNKYLTVLPIIIFLIIIGFPLSSHKITLKIKLSDEMKLSKQLVLKDWAEKVHKTADYEDSIAVRAIGLVGYYSKVRIIDMYGVTDPYLARQTFKRKWDYIAHNKWDIAYIISKNPKFILPGKLPSQEKNLLKANGYSIKLFQPHNLKVWTR